MQQRQRKNLTHHILVDLSGCPFSRLNDRPLLETLLIELAELVQTTVLRRASYQFHPQGVTALIIVGASHLTIHTWPEHGIACADLMIYAEGLRVGDVVALLEERLLAEASRVIEIERGLIEIPEPAFAGEHEGRQV